MTKYCAYIFKRGSKKGQSCKELCHLQTVFCKKHVNKNTKTPDSKKNIGGSDIPKTIIHINKLVNKKLQEDSIRERILDLPTNDTICNI
jgi:hypothetical protein